eukprot:9066219-Pyramimonas_sp.AAC.1
MIGSALTEVELHLRSRALWDRNREILIGRAKAEYSYSGFSLDGMVFLIKLELQMSSRALRQSNRKTT